MLWWWNDYGPWMFVPLLMMIICGVMMLSMMGGWGIPDDMTHTLWKS